MELSIQVSGPFDKVGLITVVFAVSEAKSSL